MRSYERQKTYHRIRREELFEARGRHGVYDPAHPDEHAPGHSPLLLKLDDRGVSTTRLDLRAGGVAVVRMVATSGSERGKGHGRALMAHIETFARAHGVTTLVVNAAPEAVGYYERMGFAREIWDTSELVGINATSVQMSKTLQPGR